LDPAQRIKITQEISVVGGIEMYIRQTAKLQGYK